MSETQKPISRPGGDYAIVELFGHTTLVGRIMEVERFGSKMLALEPIFRGELLPPVLHGGAAIYRLTPCSDEVAFSQAPTSTWSLPPAILVVVPPLLLAASDHQPTDADEGDADDDRPF